MVLCKMDLDPNNVDTVQQRYFAYLIRGGSELDRA